MGYHNEIIQRLIKFWLVLACLILLAKLEILSLGFTRLFALWILCIFMIVFIVYEPTLHFGQNVHTDKYTADCANFILTKQIVLKV